MTDTSLLILQGDHRDLMDEKSSNDEQIKELTKKLNELKTRNTKITTNLDKNEKKISKAIKGLDKSIDEDDDEEMNKLYNAANGKSASQKGLNIPDIREYLKLNSKIDDDKINTMSRKDLESCLKKVPKVKKYIEKKEEHSESDE